MASGMASGIPAWYGEPVSLTAPVQPDQDPSRWDAFSVSYERVFETLTTAFAAHAFDHLGPLEGLRLLDVAAGPGGAAIEAASRGAEVMAVDASPAMVRRIRARDAAVLAAVMDGMALNLPDSAFDVGFSCFGVVLFPDAPAGVAELRRVVRPGGRVAVVTWTEPHRYELAARLQQAIAAVRGGPLPPGPLPAQLRFVAPEALRALLVDSGFEAIEIIALRADLNAASARELANSMAFAPGMAALLEALGPERDAVLSAFVDALEADQGSGAVRLGAVAHAAIAVRPAVMVET